MYTSSTSLTPPPLLFNHPSPPAQPSLPLFITLAMYKEINLSSDSLNERAREKDWYSHLNKLNQLQVDTYWGSLDLLVEGGWGCDF